MDYQLLSAKILIYRAQLVKDQYKNFNESRLRLIKILDTFACVFEEINRVGSPPEDLNEVIMGLWLFCIETIEKEYRLLNPDYREGYFISTGSTLHKILLDALEINQQNIMKDDFVKLIYLNKFYNYVLSRTMTFRPTFEYRYLNLDAVMVDVKDILRRAFHRINIKSILQAVPDEASLDDKIRHLKQNYINECELKNQKPNRIFLARLVEAFGNLVPKSDEEDISHYIPRSQRIKMGLLIYVLQSISSEYVRSPRHHSALYDLCCSALNINQLSDLPIDMRLACLGAFRSVLGSEVHVAQLERFFKETENTVEMPPLKSLDNELAPLKDKLDGIIDSLNSHQHGISTFTKAMATVGAIVCAIPGYGLGSLAGSHFSDTDYLLEPKQKLAVYTSQGMIYMVGSIGKHIGYSSASAIMDATLSRGFAKIFEAIGLLMGAAVGGIAGLVLFDLTFATLSKIGQVVFRLHQDLDPVLAKDIHQKVIDCLLSMPDGIFSREEKRALEDIVPEKCPDTQLQSSEEDTYVKVERKSSRSEYRGELLFNKNSYADVDSSDTDVETIGSDFSITTIDESEDLQPKRVRTP